MQIRKKSVLSAYRTKSILRNKKIGILSSGSELVDKQTSYCVDEVCEIYKEKIKIENIFENCFTMTAKQFILKVFLP